MPASQSKILANLLIACISTQNSWSRAWMRNPPENCASKKKFRGANRLVLTLVAARNHWSGNRWGTEAQWSKRGFFVPRGTNPTRVLSMVEAGPMDTVCLRYGVKRVTMIRPHEEFAAVQVGDDDTWNATPPDLAGVIEFVSGAFAGAVSLSVPPAEVRSSEVATRDERWSSYIVRSALRMTIETEMLPLMDERMTDPDIVNLAAEIGMAFVLNDHGMIPERLNDQPTVRRWCALMVARPEVAMYCGGLAQHTIDRIAAAAVTTETIAAAKAA